MIALLDQAIAHLEAAKTRWERGDQAGLMTEISRVDRILRGVAREYLERAVDLG